jgi:hypothetical protein
MEVGAARELALTTIGSYEKQEKDAQEMEVGAAQALAMSVISDYERQQGAAKVDTKTDLMTKGKEAGKDSITELSAALNDAVEGIRDAINKLSEATVECTISETSIKDVGDAVRQGTEEGVMSGASSIKDALTNVTGGAGSLGAAVRPEQFEALESRVQIVDDRAKDSIGELKSEITSLVEVTKGELKTEMMVGRDKLNTDLNERFSEISSEISYGIRTELLPQIHTNGESIISIEHSTKGLEALVHVINARLGELNG